jgi:hypothetical protein
VLRVREDLGSKERNDVVGDDFARFTLEIGVVDPEVGVKPVYLVRNELAGNKSLWAKTTFRGESVSQHLDKAPTFSATAFSTRVRCSSLPLNTGVVYPGMFLTR